MKTLVPPPITPGIWEDSQPYCGILSTVKSEKGRSTVAMTDNHYIPSGQAPYPSSRIEREANAKFIAAAPAMAEALVRAMDALETFQREFNMTSGGLAEECRAALLAAGYTEAADQE